MRHIHSSNLNNPIAEARYKSGCSLDRLGRQLSLSKQYISRAEQGTYSGLNPALVKFAANVLDVSNGQIMARYMHFQSLKRKNVIERVNPRLLARRGAKAPGGKVFAEWRQMYWTSSHEFATAFCVHPESIRNYEELILTKIPEQLFRAMNSVKLIDPNWTEAPVRVSIPAQRGKSLEGG